ncbi:EAL domain-containing protein [Bacillus sp. Marseille-Q1617]|uniref:bifunctional diguanylate cyclase/phosphodiesterase n=1 Tax=Bacillus sp. Marseille-Q1617 TaxID=2736887 RepID=UPI00158AA324|nr:EAL domain-containing protein [Bacillus sp. Marseille-Q1617]
MFSLPESPDIYVLQGEYSLPMVVLSIVIACCASYTSLSLNQRMQQSSFFHKSFWLVLASVSMGLGIWSMHFIGMSAFMLPVSMTYDSFLTAASVIPAVFASYLAFSFANRKKKGHVPAIIAGIIMGIGISAMHYIGMAAMEMNAEHVYKPLILMSSVMIAVVVSYVALFIFSSLQKFMGTQWIKILTSVLMGLAITSMHYTGMAAVVFYTVTPGNGMHGMHKMDMPLLVTVVTAGIFILLAVSGLAGLLDRYVDHRLHQYDALTLLPNQRQFEQDLKNSKTAGSLAIIHIHDFEKWVSGYGYTFGDGVIKAVGEIIEERKLRTSKVYRIEGNRFAVYHSEKHEFEILKSSMEKVLSELKKPLLIDDYRVVVEMVCAASHCEEGDCSQLLANTMAVLQHPSIQFRHGVMEYDPAVHTYSFERQIVQDINRAIEFDELFMVYQPKVLPVTGEVTGVEALLRWEHRVHGMISPGVFIPVLEENGKIFEVTDWVIETVFRQVSSWLEEGVEFKRVSINIPGQYVTSSRLLSVLSEGLRKYGVDSRFIELEITETSVIHDIDNAITAVGRFREMGLSVALDDFGTGLSSLSYLRKIPISTIKIDKSFVDGVPLSEKDSALLRAIITLCSSLNLRVVIEGVESQEQIDFIMSMIERPHIQGYYFSPPLREGELVSWMAERELTGQV